MAFGAEGPSFYEPMDDNAGSIEHLKDLSEVVQFRQKSDQMERQMSMDIGSYYKGLSVVAGAVNIICHDLSLCTKTCVNQCPRVCNPLPVVDSMGILGP